jgi:2-polyprenyl-6-hydroxyphenyl methylase/3-demethylubiquinone-9 3-methyltransferase
MKSVSPLQTEAAAQRFLDYVRKAQTHEAKAPALEKHYATIQRAMQRQGTWRADARLLDLGCGLGIHSEFWQARGLRVTGLDRDQAMITHASERARAHHWPIRYELGNADRLPFADRSFDIVYANSLLEHVPDWPRCVEEWIRVLAPGGLLWIETTNVFYPRQGEFRWLPLYSWWPPFLKRIAVRLAQGPWPALANYTPWPALHWFSFFQLRRFLEARGLSVSDRFDWMDVAQAGAAKKMVRRLALSCNAGRGLTYCLVSPLIVLAVRPPDGGSPRPA